MSPVRVPRQRGLSAPAWGLLVGLVVMGLAMLVPAVTGWNVHVFSFPPLHAAWDPRLGPGTLPAVAIGVAGCLVATRWADGLGWRALLLASYAGGLAWMLALATVDGRDGIGVILQTPYEYLRTARATTDLSALLHEYVARIPYDAPLGHWPVHLAGHPPGAFLFFWVLVRLGLGSGLAAGLVVTAVAATTPLAVLVTARVLGAERLARRAAPFLVLGPAAIWQCVSADAVFAAVAAWGLAALALAGVRAQTGRSAWAGWAVVAGLLLGYAVMMSYGLPLLGILALAVLWCARSWRPVAVAAAAALVVVGLFAVAGFRYWEALPVLHDRYWDGVASRRPASYWMWGDLAALLFSAGPIAGAAAGQLVGVARNARRLGRYAASTGVAGRLGAVRGRVLAARPPVLVVLVLSTAGWAMVLAADVSQMSRAEVERIWLPFVPWLLLGTALLPERWRTRGLVLQVAFALVVQHLLDTGW